MSFSSIQQLVHADNCQACGQEQLNIELVPVKLGNKSLSRIRICLGCLVHTNKEDYSIQNDYQEAIELLTQTTKKLSNQ